MHPWWGCNWSPCESRHLLGFMICSGRHLGGLTHPHQELGQKTERCYHSVFPDADHPAPMWRSQAELLLALEFCLLPCVSPNPLGGVGLGCSASPFEASEQCRAAGRDRARREESWSKNSGGEGGCRKGWDFGPLLSATGVFCLRHPGSNVSNGTTWTQRGAGRGAQQELCSPKGLTAAAARREVSFSKKEGQLDSSAQE